MIYDFDKTVDRSHSDSFKWRIYPADVQPLWVADTDFEVAPEIVAEIQKRLSHPVFGYAIEIPGFKETIVRRMADRYQWAIKEEAVFLVPGIVSGYNFACRAFVRPGQAVLIQTPAYPPFFTGPQNNQVESVLNPLVFNAESGRYEIDFEDFEARIRSGKVDMFVLCNPQNPTGRVFTREELTRMADICAMHHVVIVSDEIHSDIIYSGENHTPIASIAPDIGNHCLTLIAPSKTFNIPGFACSVGIIQDPTLRERYARALRGLAPQVSLLSQYGGLAAYQYGGEWLKQMNAYLEANRDFVFQTVAAELPDVRQSKPQATFLSWLDFSETKIADQPFKFFLDNAKVALNDGKTFGDAYGSFVRLNFGTNRARLSQALDKMIGAYRKK